MLRPMDDETLLWEGRSSQWLNFGHYAAALVLAVIVIIAGANYHPLAFIALVLPAGYALWRFLVIHTHVFRLSCQRLRITWGVINQHIDEIELYRVKDSIILRPWWMRLTGLSSISLETSDRTLPKLLIPALPKGVETREILRKQVEIQRDKKRVREMDFDDVEGEMEF
ncbi:MAG TPA: PH domain-containing protein [Luteolibacter sp.]|nr:PH domain-containing protein [Luteolibacter sp.]